MHAVVYGALRTAQRPILRSACRVVGGIRRPQLRRSFHRSRILYQLPDETNTPEAGEGNAISETALDDGKLESEPPKVAEVDSESALFKQGKHSKPASGRTRVNRPKKSNGLPPVILPEWFLAKNVKCVEDYDFPTGNTVEGKQNTILKADDTTEVTIQPNDEGPNSSLTTATGSKYLINVDVYKEILATLKAGLSLRPPRNTNKRLLRPNTLLQCPKDSGTYYLDSIVEKIAGELEADLVQIDAQDIAQILGPYVNSENLAWTSSDTSLIGYRSQGLAGKLEEYERDITAQEDGDGMEEDEDALSTYKSGKSPLISSDLSRKLASMFSSKKPGRSGFSTSKYGGGIGETIVKVQMLGDAPTNHQQTSDESGTRWIGLKMKAALNSLIGAADTKRATRKVPEEEKSTESESEAPILARNTIIQLKDYRTINGTDSGPEIIRALKHVIDKRWLDGRNIILVGTTSTEDCGLTRPDIQHLQSDITNAETRTILVPPICEDDQDSSFEIDEKARIRLMNVRHLEDMIKNLADGAHDAPAVVDIEEDLDNATAYSAGIEEAVWTYPRVHRTAVTILGLGNTSKVDGIAFKEAWKLLSSSDEAKFDWGAAELKREDDDVDVMLKDLNESSQQVTSEKIKQIKKSCTVHEKRLLGGVIVPSDIHTTFGDVRAPKDTVEALKTLTNLSLIRPDAFSYGVLATDKIPGLLLYGPPGTGKTLLAKAVAKESGATVLEVSGAEINDMYVGEGEKNVKAIFTLAKKLSPCVVFIDEADAIFAQRSDTKRSGTHRELINQFLREWDGMNNLSAFIMVATNRPFDLDEAVLRRLPRRLLVDLPLEKDREAILKIHLKDEILDESVSLATLAKNTPYYSGSDLKNISVAAAFACIREENEVASKHTGDEPYVYPERRILKKQHFDKALDEISASISEDMSTLAAIRKFDEKYGDRKGRRKKGSGLGFGGTTAPEKDSEGGRVRKVEL